MSFTLRRCWIYYTLSIFAVTMLTGCSGCQRKPADAASSSAEATADESQESSSKAATTEPTTPETAGDATVTQDSNEVDRSYPKDSPPQSESPPSKSRQAAASATDVARSGSSGAGKAPTLTAEATLQKAEELYRSAQSGGGDPGRAFQEATQAWELLNQHPENAKCQAMAAEILQQLDALAASANQANKGMLLDDPTLLEK